MVGDSKRVPMDVHGDLDVVLHRDEDVRVQLSNVAVMPGLAFEIISFHRIQERYAISSQPKRGAVAWGTGYLQEVRPYDNFIEATRIAHGDVYTPPAMVAALMRPVASSRGRGHLSAAVATAASAAAAPATSSRGGGRPCAHSTAAVAPATSSRGGYDASAASAAAAAATAEAAAADAVEQQQKRLAAMIKRRGAELAVRGAGRRLVRAKVPRTPGRVAFFDPSTLPAASPALMSPTPSSPDSEELSEDMAQHGVEGARVDGQQEFAAAPDVTGARAQREGLTLESFTLTDTQNDIVW